MKGLMIFIAVVVLVHGISIEYNKPSCGTATVCGSPIHDLLHKVWP